MITSLIRQVFVAQHQVDFRKGFDGLLGEAYRLGIDPYEGVALVFFRKDRSQIRILVGDELGLYLVSRRFDGGSIKIDWIVSEQTCKKSITHGELAMLLEGASFVVKKRVRPCKSK